ncbi:MAG: HAD family hydrolase [Sulfurimonas sp.]|uniref:HAD family hydrolase n=1 Tax=Sulfurimonas sp. TaxID=2022749 RepID=UPI0026128B06|nr:HAD family hydrolase [Sulfurimonas sp.]MCW8894994.1 HAD family hydrolase [Sulfurimonas sp.]MCW8953642.1 HAD family hydrolase [Sulfurimonas sp.]MCW9066850.1 HAD family hydrolase [Sulfurimonas sp.]
MKVVIFDMDGTLLDSKKDLTISVNHVRKHHYNLAPLSEEFIVEAINMKVRNLSQLFYETDVYHDKDRELFEIHYAMQCVQNPYLYDGVRETLNKLVVADVKISVATNAPTPFAKRMLKHLEVDHLFDVIIGADKVQESKPSPEMLNKILEHYKFDKNSHRAWMVGDNIKDMLSAQSAGIDSMFATWGFSPNSDDKVVIRRPSEILDIVL